MYANICVSLSNTRIYAQPEIYPDGAKIIASQDQFQVCLFTVGLQI